MSNRTAALCRLLGPPPDPRDDGDLLTAFVRHNDEAAFAELIRRHGPLMLSACRRLLPDHCDAEDAFQSAFLVLIRRAARLHSLPSLGPWLYRVAVLTARNARRRNARRYARQSVLPDSVPDSSSTTATELRLDLDAALLGLPEKLRTPIVLCHLQGWTRRDAARRLGCPEGTLSSLLARGLEKLRHRLSGFDPVKLLAVPSVVVPATLSISTVQAATTALAATTFHVTLSTLAEGVIRMFWIKKTTAATVALVAMFGMGVGVGVSVRQAPHAGASTGTAAAVAAEPPATAKEAARALEVIADADEAAQLDDLKKKLREAQAELNAAEKVHKLAVANLELVKKTAGTPAAIEKAQADVDRAERTILVGFKRYQELQLQLGELEARAQPKAKSLLKELEKMTPAEIEALKREFEAADEEYVAARKSVDAAKERLRILQEYVKDAKDLKPETDKLKDHEKKMQGALERVKATRERLTALADVQPKAPPANTDAEKQLAETKALLEQMRAQRAILEQDLRRLQRNALDLDQKSEALTEQLKLLELRKAKELKEKVLVPPSPAAGSGPALVITIDETPNVVCTLTESGPGGKAIGTLSCDTADILRVTLGRAMKDPTAPKDIRIVAKSGAGVDKLKAVLDACKAAGVKDVRVSAFLQRAVPVTSSPRPVATIKTMTQKLEDEATTVESLLEKIAPVKP